MSATTRFFTRLFVLCAVLMIAPGAFPVLGADRVPPATKVNPTSGGYVAIVSANAAADSGAPIGSYFVIGNMATDISHPAIAYNSHAREYLVVWQTDVPTAGNIWAARLRRDGKVLGTYEVEAGGGVVRSRPDVAYNEQDHDYYIVWQYIDGGYSRIRGKPFSPGGPVYGSMQLSTGVALKNCYEPAVAYAGSAYKFIVVWERHVQGSLVSDIEAQVLTGGGAFEGANFLIKPGTTNNSHSQPDVAYNRSRNEYMVVWTWHDSVGPNDDILGRIVTRDGVILGGNDVVVGYHTPPETVPAVAGMPTTANYGGYLVAWELHYSAADHDIYARTIPGRIGVEPALPLGSVVQVASAGANETVPAVGANDLTKRYLVSWTETYPPPFTINVGIKARELSLSGALDGAAEWVGGAFSGVSAASGGPTGDFLVAYDEAGLFGGVDIWGRLWGRRVYLPLVLRAM